MYAVGRVTEWDAAKLEAGQAEIAEFERIHAEQPGFLGSLVVDLGQNRHATVNLWQSQAQAQAALPTVGPVVGRLLAPLMAAESQLLGTGPVIRGADLIADDSA